MTAGTAAVSPRRPAPVSWALALMVAVAGGLWWGTRFGVAPSPWLAWLALAPVAWLALPSTALGMRRRFVAAWVHGFVAWCVGIPWIAYTLQTFGGLSPVLSWALLGVLAAYLGLFHGVFAWVAAATLGPWWRPGGLARRWPRLSAVAPWVVVPALWVLAERLRAVALTGFPWNLAAYAWVEVPGALALCAWVGSYGVSFLVGFAGVGCALSFARRRLAPAVVGTLVPLLVLALAGRWAQQPIAAERVVAPTAVRVLQPNIPNLLSFDGVAVRRSYATVMDQARRACDDVVAELAALGLDPRSAEVGALLVLPESALWPYQWPRDSGLVRDLEALRARGCSVLFNSPYWPAAETSSVGAPRPDGPVFNSTYLLAPGAPAQRYDKRHLVPYGEYVPLGEIFPFIDSMARNAGDFSAAEEVRVLPWGPETLGVALCYEGIFPGEVAATVSGGATALVVMSNDAWFGTSAARRQHFRAAQFRAAENRRPLLRAAITGISGVISAEGRVLGEIGPDRRDVLSTWLQGRSDLSPFTRRPWLVPALSAALVLLFATAGRLRAAR